jgi:hypothetical protein
MKLHICLAVSLLSASVFAQQEVISHKTLAEISGAIQGDAKSTTRDFVLALSNDIRLNAQFTLSKDGLGELCVERRCAIIYDERTFASQRFLPSLLNQRLVDFDGDGIKDVLIYGAASSTKRDAKAFGVAACWHYDSKAKSLVVSYASPEISQRERTP